MTRAVRVIPCLDVDAGRVVKGVNFAGLVDAGDPVEMARVYDAEGADELVFLDITASSGSRETTYDVVRRTAEQVFIPLTVGGGVRAVEDVDRLLRAGADKVGVNTAAIARPELLARSPSGSAARCSCCRSTRAARPAPTSGFEVTTHGGRPGTGLDAVAWAARAQELGVGEVLLNSMDADGTRDGYDLELLRAVRAAVSVPVVASGGAGAARGLRAGGRGRRRRGAGRERLPLRAAPDRRRSRPRCGRPGPRSADPAGSPDAPPGNTGGGPRYPPPCRRPPDAEDWSTVTRARAPAGASSAAASACSAWPSARSRGSSRSSAVGSALFALMTIAQAYVFGAVTDQVIVPAHRDGEAAPAALGAGLPRRHGRRGAQGRRHRRPAARGRASCSTGCRRPTAAG